MAPRVGILVGIVAITGGIAWFALRGRGGDRGDTGKIAPEGSDRLTGGGTGSDFIRRTRDGKAAPFAPAGPSIGSDDSTTGGSAVAPAPEPSTAFEAEVRDGAWAIRTEDEIKRRFRSLKGGSLDAAECRRDQCLLSMSGTEEQLMQTVAEIETTRGLRNFADHIVLGGPEQRDGKLVLKAYAMFSRDGVPGSN